MVKPSASSAIGGRRQVGDGRLKRVVAVDDVPFTIANNTTFGESGRKLGRQFGLFLRREERLRSAVVDDVLGFAQGQAA